ncbi:MAG: glycosyl transferase [bacterium]|nr:MAG: glycosyl transferase [bacterium]
MKQEKIIYCTYFDKGFLTKGLALHASLIKYNPDAKLWVLAFDKYTEDVLRKMKLKGVTVVPLREFEDKELLAIKDTRTKVEYIWTTTPSWPLYIFKKSPKTMYVCYLDADEYFYSNPQIIIDEAYKGSMLAVEHRYLKGMERLIVEDGQFNVAVNVFKNDSTGIKCLKRWRNQCLDWCYWRFEDGKLGDQLYLNEWPRLYGKKLVISKNIGVNVAPWNHSQYKVRKVKSDIYINKTKLVCYHFHQFQVLGPTNFSRVLGYTLSKDVVKHIYEPYEKELIKQYKFVKKYDKSFQISPPKNGGNKIQLIKHKLAKYIGPFYWRIKGWQIN